jgi:hypothetical protein
MFKIQIADLKFLLQIVLDSCISSFLLGEQRVSLLESLFRVFREVHLY